MRRLSLIAVVLSLLCLPLLNLHASASPISIGEMVIGLSGAEAAGKGASPAELFTNGRVPKASEIANWAESQGWKAVKTENGPLKYVDENGIPRVTIKQGSPRTPGSETPHVEFKGADGSRTDPFGNPVTRKNKGNHSPIDFNF